MSNQSPASRESLTPQRERLEPESIRVSLNVTDYSWPVNSGGLGDELVRVA
jgi:hypothetical protein